MKNFVLKYLFLSVSLIGPVVQTLGQKSDPPNIVFILADDLGWSSLSCSMDPQDSRAKSDYHETPNLEKLARQGMRFSRGYSAASICSPSRRSILLGQTPARLGDESFVKKFQPLKAEHQTIPRLLKLTDRRYKAAHFGKWDMRAGFFPEDAGYDESDGNTGNRNGDVMTAKDDKWTSHFLVDDPKRMYSLTGRAINFMERNARAGNPFFLQVSHYATHVDLQATDSSYQKYQQKPAGAKHTNPAFAGMLADLDHTIGLIMAKIEALGIGDNTYIFFTADNGATEFIPPVKNRLDHPSIFDRPMRNDPLRGGKWTLYEGGIRVPLIVKGPGIAPDSHSDVTVAGWDFLPTFVELAGGSVNEIQTRDGGSFARNLKGDRSQPVVRTTHDLIFHRYNNAYPHSALIDRNWKIIKFWKTGRIELYNLSADAGEKTDLARTDKARAEAMTARLVRYLNEVNPGLISSYSK